MADTEYLSGCALVKKVGNKLQVVETPYGIADRTPVAAEGASSYTTLSQWMLRKAQVFHNVAEMKASLVLADGMSCVTEGYYEPGDGGMGFYRIRPMTASDTDDGGSIHALQNGLCAELIDEGFVRPEQFGAKGDGVTDDAGRLGVFFNNGKFKNLRLSKEYYCSTSVTVTGIPDLDVSGGNFSFHNAVGSGLVFQQCPNLRVSKTSLTANGNSLKTLRFEECNNLFVDGATVTDSGASGNAFDAIGIVVYGPCDGVLIKNCVVDGIYCGTGYAASGISLEGAVTNAVITRNRVANVKDIGTTRDSDGIKVLGDSGNYDRNILISENIVKNCRKRALKFQARGCHSRNNLLWWTADMTRQYCAIDFQRGYGDSIGDVIVHEHVPTDPDDYQFYIFLAVQEGYVTIDDITINLADDQSGLVTNSPRNTLLTISTLLGASEVSNVILKNVSGNFAVQSIVETAGTLAVSKLFVEGSFKVLGQKIFTGTKATYSDSVINLKVDTGGKEPVLENYSWTNSSINIEASNTFGTRFLGFADAMRSNEVSINTLTGEGNSFVASRGRVRWTRVTSKPGGYGDSLRQMFTLCKTGDTATIVTPVVTDSGVQTGWICTADPSESFPYGEWKEVYV